MLFSSCFGSPFTALSKFRFKHESIERQKFELFRAIMQMEHSKITSLLALDAPVNFNVPDNWRYRINRNYFTPAPAWGDLPLVHLVAMIGDESTLESLIAAGANVHVKHEELDSYKASGPILSNTLHLHTKVQVYKKLIAAGADVNAVNSAGFSVVQALFNSDTDFNKSQYIWAEKVQILHLLVSSGARLTSNNTVQMLNLINKKPISEYALELLDLCIQNGYSIKPESGGNLLHALAKNLVIDSPKKQAFIERILDSNISLNEQDDDGRTVLYCAASNPSFMKLLLEHKVTEDRETINVNLADKNGITPLHVSAESACLECVQHLVKSNANIQATSSSGTTVFHLAAANKSLSELLKHNHNCDVRDNTGTTPLMLAISKGMLNNASALLRNGADIFAKDNQGKTMVDFAIDNQHSLAYVQAEMTCKQATIVNASQLRLAQI